MEEIELENTIRMTVDTLINFKIVKNCERHLLEY